MELVATELGHERALPLTGASLSCGFGSWLAMASVALFVAGMLAAGQGGTLRFAFPAAAMAVGFYLYWKHPVHYIAFAWWVWFLSPFIRRLVDHQSGWVDPSPVLRAPVLVSFIAGLGFLRYFLPAAREGGAPFALPFAGTVYGLGVGRVSVVSAMHHALGVDRVGGRAGLAADPDGFQSATADPCRHRGAGRRGRAAGARAAIPGRGGAEDADLHAGEK